MTLPAPPLPKPPQPATLAEARELARLALAGKARSMVQTALELARFVLNPALAELVIEPDPFPTPDTQAPPAERAPTPLPGEHRLTLPPALATPPPPRNAPSFDDELPPKTISDRPDPYRGPAASRPTPKSRASVVPHPADSSRTRVFDFSPANTPPLPPPPFDPAPNTTGKLRCLGHGCLDTRCDCNGPIPIPRPSQNGPHRTRTITAMPPPPPLRVFCGECDHENCICTPSAYDPPSETGS